MFGLDPERVMREHETQAAEQRRLDGMSSADATDQLINAWHLLNAPYMPFDAGDIVKPIKGLEATYSDPPGRRLLFVEWLSEDDMRYGERDSLKDSRSGIQFDCVVGRIMSGGTVGLILYDSRFLELVDGDGPDEGETVETAEIVPLRKAA